MACLSQKSPGGIHEGMPAPLYENALLDVAAEPDAVIGVACTNRGYCWALLGRSCSWLAGWLAAGCGE